MNVPKLPARAPAWIVPILAAVVVAAVLVMASAPWTMRPTVAHAARTRGCAVPTLPGATVNVTLVDMGGGMMGGGMMGGGMRLLVSPASVPAGEVSFRVRNVGGLVHEMVVLPLAPGVAAGTRAVGPDGRVSEAGSLGEASRSCGAGAGEGIRPGTSGWVTLRLRPGHYELVCNIPGHYAAGMFAELDVG